MNQESEFPQRDRPIWTAGETAHSCTMGNAAGGQDRDDLFAENRLLIHDVYILVEIWKSHSPIR